MLSYEILAIPEQLRWSVNMIHYMEKIIRDSPGPVLRRSLASAYVRQLYS